MEITNFFFNQVVQYYQTKSSTDKLAVASTDVQPPSKRQATSSVEQLEKRVQFAKDTDFKSDTPNDDVANKRARLNQYLDTRPSIKKKYLKSIIKVDEDQTKSGDE